MQAPIRAALAALLLTAATWHGASGGVAGSDTAGGPAIQEDAAAKPEASALVLSYDAMVASHYLFQGTDYSDGKAVIQPAASLRFRSVTASVWSNFQSDLGHFNEIDLNIKYTREQGAFTGSMGYQVLRYPHRPTWDPSQELFFEAAFGVPLSPSFNIHYDFDAGKGTYSQLSLTQPTPGSGTLGINLFYQTTYYGVTGFPAVELNVKRPVSLGGVTITPSMSYFAKWSNGDFTDALSTRRQWLFSLDLGQQF